MIKDTIRNLYINHESTAAFVAGNANVIIGKPGLAITYNYRILTDALAEYVKQRNDIISKYGTKDEEGNIVLEPGTEGHTKAYQELEEIESMELEVFPMLLDLEDLAAISEKVPMAQLVNIIWMTKKYQYERDTDGNKPERFTGTSDEPAEESDKKSDEQ